MKSIDVSIYDVPLSMRARNFVKGANITSIAQLACFSPEDILRDKGVGTLAEIKAVVESYGFSLKPAAKPIPVTLNYRVAKKEYGTITAFVDKKGNETSFRRATLVMVQMAGGYSLPFSKSFFSQLVKIGDEVVDYRTVITHSRRYA